MDAWEEKYPQVVNASGKLHGISDELILMSHLRLMISMDSGNMHLASLVNIPVVSIWGATHPYAGLWAGIRVPTMPCSSICLAAHAASMATSRACVATLPA